MESNLDKEFRVYYGNEDLTHDLFEKVNIKIQNYKNEIKVTGEGFNVFQILGLSKREVRTHTAFIYELLNPNGSHGMDTTFLNLFLEELRIMDGWNIEIPINKKNVVVLKEQFIGKSNEDFTEGGSIDLIIKYPSKIIIIENKIDAADQLNQLMRYHKYGKEQQIESFELIYLTLNGRQATNYSKGNALKESDYKKISYKSNILSWLYKCREKIQEKTLLHPTLSQYIYLIETLTGKTKYNDMEKEIQKIIVSSSSYFEIGKQIKIQFDKILNEVIPQNIREHVDIVIRREFHVEQELKLFSYKSYEIFITILEEDKDNWFAGIFPRKGNELEAAYDDDLAVIKNALTPLNNNADYYSNKNYFLWRDFKWNDYNESSAPDKRWMLFPLFRKQN